MTAPTTKNAARVERTRSGRSCWSTRARKGPPMLVAVPDTPATAPAAAALREVIRISIVVSEAATVTRMRTATADREGAHGEEGHGHDAERGEGQPREPAPTRADATRCRRVRAGAGPRAARSSRRGARPGMRSGREDDDEGRGHDGQPEADRGLDEGPRHQRRAQAQDHRPVHHPNQTMRTIATRPMVMMTARRTAGGSRRPTREPSSHPRARRPRSAPRRASRPGRGRRRRRSGRRRR